MTRPVNTHFKVLSLQICMGMSVGFLFFKHFEEVLSPKSKQINELFRAAHAHPLNQAAAMYSTGVTITAIIDRFQTILKNEFYEGEREFLSSFYNTLSGTQIVSGLGLIALGYYFDDQTVKLMGVIFTINGLLVKLLHNNVLWKPLPARIPETRQVLANIPPQETVRKKKLKVKKEIAEQELKNPVKSPKLSPVLNRKETAPKIPTDVFKTILKKLKFDHFPTEEKNLELIKNELQNDFGYTVSTDYLRNRARLFLKSNR